MTTQHGVEVEIKGTCAVCLVNEVKVKKIPLTRWEGRGYVQVCNMCIRDISKAFRGFK